MINVTLGVGSNCGDRMKLVEQALEWLKSVLIETKVSSIYETPCAKKVGKPYVNVVVQGFYSGDAFQLNDLLKEKEHEMGRTAECKAKGDVPIDIDIVICDGTIYKPWDYRQKFFRIGYEEII